MLCRVTDKLSMWHTIDAQEEGEQPTDKGETARHEEDDIPLRRCLSTIDEMRRPRTFKER